MSEEQIEWRDAWKKLIDASREMILNGKKDDTSPFDKLTSLQDDKMLLFEKAIAFECLGNAEKAKELYKMYNSQCKMHNAQLWSALRALFEKRCNLLFR